MIRFRPRRWLPLLRVLVLVLFALGLVLQPVMAAAGEMHEFAHDPSGMHSDALQADSVDAELAAAAGEQGEGGTETLHVLLDWAHCCGATAAMLPGIKLIPMMPATNRLIPAEFSIPPPGYLPAPFKPPIFA